MSTALKASRRWLQAAFRAGFDFVYPPRCFLCGLDLGGQPSRGGFCDPCQRGLIVHADKNSCRRCGGPIGPHLDPDGPCMSCRKERYAFTEVARLGVYEDALRSACVLGKLPRRIPLVEALAALAWDHFHQKLVAWNVDFVTAVPHHWTQRFTRQHNPAAVLAEAWGHRLRAPVDIPILAKTQRTTPQVRLTPTQRRANLRDVFRVSEPAAVRDATILLADDVLTTGTTAHRAARALRDAGAKQVVVAVLARGIGHH